MLAEQWPKFLQNNALTNALTKIEPKNLSMEDQARLLRISTLKNLVLPQFIKAHFN